MMVNNGRKQHQIAFLLFCEIIFTIPSNFRLTRPRGRRQSSVFHRFDVACSWIVFWCKLLDAIVKIKVCVVLLSVFISGEEKQYKNFLPPLPRSGAWCQSFKTLKFAIDVMETVVCSTRFTSYQYEIQMLSAVAEACKSAGDGIWMQMCSSPARFPLICIPHCFSVITFRFFLSFTISTRRSQVSHELAVFLSFFSSPWTFVNYYVFIQRAIHLDSVIYGFLTSFHSSIVNPNQFHILLLIFLHFDRQQFKIFLLLTVFSSFLFYKVETFFFLNRSQIGLELCVH